MKKNKAINIWLNGYGYKETQMDEIFNYAAAEADFDTAIMLKRTGYNWKYMSIEDLDKMIEKVNEDKWYKKELSIDVDIDNWRQKAHIDELEMDSIWIDMTNLKMSKMVEWIDKKGGDWRNATPQLMKALIDAQISKNPSIAWEAEKAIIQGTYNQNISLESLDKKIHLTSEIWRVEHEFSEQEMDDVWNQVIKGGKFALMNGLANDGIDWRSIPNEMKDGILLPRLEALRSNEKENIYLHVDSEHEEDIELEI